jgi:ribonuclease P protein component
LAVTRNKAKRWVRAIFGAHDLGKGFVVVIRVGFLDLGFKSISLDFNATLSKFQKDFLNKTT